MSRAGELVQALAATAPRYSPADRSRKRELLDALAAIEIRVPSALLRLHETLCFLQAYPDDPDILARVDRGLDAIPARVARLRPAARTRLHGSGIAGTTLDYPFGLPMTRWLLARARGAVEIAWGKVRDEERIDDVLALLVTKAEEDAFTEGGLGGRRWLDVATGGRRRAHLDALASVFAQAALPGAVRDWLFETLELPVLWRLSNPALSRTMARLPHAPTIFHPDGPRRQVDVIAEVKRPLGAIRRAARLEADALIDAARLAMATRERELHCFSHPNPDDVWLADPEPGLRITLFGIRPEARQSFEAYYGFLALKNGVPVSYGAGWCLFDALEFAFNVFPSFRQGESTFVMSQVLRVYRQHLGRTTFAIDPFQIGRDNEEAIRSGAFYFYYRAGFRPLHADVLRVLAGEEARIARDAAYRSPPAVLRRLARDEIHLRLDDRRTAPPRRVSASDLAAVVTRWIAREHAGDRAAATRAYQRVGELLW
ncbi:MAG TPA: hypothetical protein VML54_14710, partial [Candidatus Limnocylindrales bacterium]|nr:hypothetical protein [Candidatus Limnocylindrales bacterium]